jgi:hypothetical protein
MQQETFAKLEQLHNKNQFEDKETLIPFQHPTKYDIHMEKTKQKHIMLSHDTENPGPTPFYTGPYSKMLGCPPTELQKSYDELELLNNVK